MGFKEQEDGFVPYKTRYGEVERSGGDSVKIKARISCGSVDGDEILTLQFCENDKIVQSFILYKTCKKNIYWKIHFDDYRK